MAPSTVQRLRGRSVGSQAILLGLDAPFFAFTAPNALEANLTDMEIFYPKAMVSDVVNIELHDLLLGKRKRRGGHSLR